MVGWQGRGADHPYLNRELSWVALYRRRLYEAANPQQPLGDRLIGIAQVSVQLDEYFMVRGAALKQGIVQGEATPSPDGLPPIAQLRQLRSAMGPLIQRQQAQVKLGLRPQLAAHGIHLREYAQLTPDQQKTLADPFEEDIAPVLSALVVAPGQDWPEFSNLSLTLAVGLQDPAGQSTLAWVKVPRSLPRFLPVIPGTDPWIGVPLEQVIAAHVPRLFPGATCQWVAPIRVTRSAHLELDDPDIDNLREWVEDNVQQRQYQGLPVRLETGPGLPPRMIPTLLRALGLGNMDHYPTQDWLAYGDLVEVVMMLPPSLRPDSLPTVPLFPRSRPALGEVSGEMVFQGLRRGDWLVHLPYHGFGATVEQFVAAAAADPQVLAIKMTLYRTAGNAPVVRSLLQAAKDGKQVVVLVELTAPLDEEANLHWARTLEKVGAHVVYGVVGLKTHTNLILVVRQEGATLGHYTYIGTGDYLPHRLQPYGDIGLLTGNRDLGQDLSHLFNFLTGYCHHWDYRHLLVAPIALRSRLMALIHQEVEQVRQGRGGKLVAKLNVLADPAIIDALYAASQAGVEINLIVRGVCCLRPGVPGLSDRIQVISILGPWVEHSRILYCQNGDRPWVYMGSADWTTKGLDQRIEVLTPILAPALGQELIQFLDHLWADTTHAWELLPDGRYQRRQSPPRQSPVHAHRQWHQVLSRRYQEGGF